MLLEDLCVFFHLSLVPSFSSLDQHQERHIGLQERIANMVHHRLAQLQRTPPLILVMQRDAEFYGFSTLFNGLVQDCGICSASALEILQSCTKPLIRVQWLSCMYMVFMIYYRIQWLSARLQYIQCASNGYTTVLLQTINMGTIIILLRKSHPNKVKCQHNFPGLSVFLQILNNL